MQTEDKIWGRHILARLALVVLNISDGLFPPWIITNATLDTDRFKSKGEKNILQGKKGERREISARICCRNVVIYGNTRKGLKMEFKWHSIGYMSSSCRTGRPGQHVIPSFFYVKFNPSLDFNHPNRVYNFRVIGFNSRNFNIKTIYNCFESLTEMNGT